MFIKTPTLHSFLSKLDLAVRFHLAKGEEYMAQYLNNHLDLLKDITEKKKKYLGASYYVPGELLALFDVHAIYIERFAGLAAAWRLFESPATQAVEQGFPATRCSYQALFHLLLQQKIIPKPACFTALSFACKDAWMYCRDEAKQYRIPFYFIDIPKAETEKQLMILAAKLEELYNNLKMHFPLSTSMAEVVAISNKAQDLKNAIDIFRIKNPQNISIINLFKIFPLYNDLGKKSTVEILQTFKNNIEENLVTDDIKNKAKILWLGVVPLYKNGLLKNIEDHFDCKIVGEEMFDFGTVRLGCDTFFKDLAQRIISSRFFTWESRVDTIFKMVKTFGINGIIHFSHRNCRFLPPLVPSISRKAEELNIPFVEIQGDVVDPTYFDEQKMWESLKSFYKKIGGGFKCISM